MVHPFSTRLVSSLVLSSLLSILVASPVPPSLSRVITPDFGLDSIDLTPAPGLPPLASIPGITIADLLEPPAGLVARHFDEKPAAISVTRSQHCIPAGFPLTHGSELSSYMWEEVALRVAYNYLRLLGQTTCEVPPGGVIFVDGWVNGYFVRVMGVSRWGVQGPEGTTVASSCEDVARGMVGFMGQEAGCLVPFEDYFINGGAATAFGNGDLWVST